MLAATSRKRRGGDGTIRGVSYEKFEQGMIDGLLSMAEYVEKSKAITGNANGWEEL